MTFILSLLFVLNLCPMPWLFIIVLQQRQPQPLSPPTHNVEMLVHASIARHFVDFWQIHRKILGFRFHSLKCSNFCSVSSIPFDSIAARVGLIDFYPNKKPRRLREKNAERRRHQAKASCCRQFTTFIEWNKMSNKWASERTGQKKIGKRMKRSRQTKCTIPFGGRKRKGKSENELFKWEYFIVIITKSFFLSSVSASASHISPMSLSPPIWMAFKN